MVDGKFSRTNETTKETRKFEYKLLRKAGLSADEARRARDFPTSHVILIIERGHLQ